MRSILVRVNPDKAPQKGFRRPCGQILQPTAKSGLKINNGEWGSFMKNTAMG
jgi:hypothetical protein